MVMFLLTSSTPFILNNITDVLTLPYFHILSLMFMFPVKQACHGAFV